MGHALAPAIVLGRAAGLPESVIQTLIENKDLSGLIDAATTALASGMKKRRPIMASGLEAVYRMGRRADARTRRVS